MFGVLGGEVIVGQEECVVDGDVPLSLGGRFRAWCIKRGLPDTKEKRASIKTVLECNKGVGSAGEAVVNRRSWQRVPSLPSRQLSLHWTSRGRQCRQLGAGTDEVLKKDK